MNDYIIRAIAANDQIRAFAAVTTETVETARQDHNTSPVATAALGRLLTAGAMMGTMMKGDKDILTLQIKAGGPLEGITVTADSKGRVKGYVGNPDVCIPANSKGKLDVAANRQATALRGESYSAMLLTSYPFTSSSYTNVSSSDGSIHSEKMGESRFI